MNEVEELEKFYKLVETKEYHEAHEQMEDYWREVKKSISKEYSLPFKGLINGATALLLHEWGRASYKEVWKTYLKYCDMVDLENGDSQKVYLRCKGLLEERYKALL